MLSREIQPPVAPPVPRVPEGKGVERVHRERNRKRAPEKPKPEQEQDEEDDQANQHRVDVTV